MALNAAVLVGIDIFKNYIEPDGCSFFANFDMFHVNLAEIEVTEEEHSRLTGYGWSFSEGVWTIHL